MEEITVGPVKLRTEVEQWPLVTPFRITGHTFDIIDVLMVTLERDGCIGRGEAAGVYYRHENPTSMLEQIDPLRAQIESGITREALQQLLPPGGARNALDCALWDLEAKLSNRPAWQLAGLLTCR
jgi:L-alanine-DL-glutamate epimerase-like enolase superfamily enzyme